MQDETGFTIRAKSFNTIEAVSGIVRSKTTDYSASLEIAGAKIAYIIPKNATGIWEGLNGVIALWDVSQWFYIVPTENDAVRVHDEPFSIDILDELQEEDVFLAKIRKEIFQKINGVYVFYEGDWVRIQKAQTIVGMVEGGRFNYNVPFLKTSGIARNCKPWTLLNATPIGRGKKTVEEFLNKKDLNSSEIVRTIETELLFIQDTEACSDNPISRQRGDEETERIRPPFVTPDGVLSTFKTDMSFPATFINSARSSEGERIFFCQDTDLIYYLDYRDEEGLLGRLAIPLFTPDGVLRNFSPDDSGFVIQLLMSKWPGAEPAGDGWTEFRNSL